MKLLEVNAGTICNSELLHVLTERGADGSGKATIVERMAYQYISSQPVQPLTPKQLQEFFDVLQPYNLSRGELLQLANLAPRSPVEVHLVVADCDVRLGDEGVEAILAAVAERVAKEEGPEEEAVVAMS
ncbi:hypothetical protein Vretimale_15851 [Volvox reticuliferus]|uniref:DNA-directed RNA polymerase III subunit RPC9 n=1 Tax=Volvox reticuliferus TaxID=1737510 RepID=A0A8J4CKK9_9CHLO|nr:hypothetical protein Vretifemale_12908 [Volvox reticuliferus]GIM12522.1 hypothetical protein Vretimale_15851 [Volvox reticuliferus]